MLAMQHLPKAARSFGRPYRLAAFARQPFVPAYARGFATHRIRTMELGAGGLTAYNSPEAREKLKSERRLITHFESPEQAAQANPHYPSTVADLRSQGHVVAPGIDLTALHRGRTKRALRKALGKGRRGSIPKALRMHWAYPRSMEETEHKDAELINKGSASIRQSGLLHPKGVLEALVATQAGRTPVTGDFMTKHLAPYHVPHPDRASEIVHERRKVESVPRAGGNVLTPEVKKHDLRSYVQNALAHLPWLPFGGGKKKK